MTTTRNLHEVSAFLFFLLAFFLMASVLALRNNYFSGFTIFLMRIIDIPFAFIALLYGGSGLYLQLNEGAEEPSPWGMVVVGLCILLFGAVVFVNFAFPSQL